MTAILGITNLVLQGTRYYDCITFVNATKKQLQNIGDIGWDSHMKKLRIITKHDIGVPKMNTNNIIPKRYKHINVKKTSYHHFRVGRFFNFIDQIPLG